MASRGGDASPAAGGSPLPAELAAELGARMGHAVEDVIVHADGAAAAAARSLHAEAFTLGQHVYFAEGRWRPHTDAGRELLAHELVHVIHQRGAGGATRSAGALEHEADRVARTIAHGGTVAPSELSAGAAPAGTPQARDVEEVRADLEAIEARRETIVTEMAETNAEFAPYLVGAFAGTRAEAMALWEEIKATEREKLILDTIEVLLIDEETTGTQRIPRFIEVLIEEAELSSKTEDATIQYLMEILGSGAAIPREVQRLIFEHAQYFPRVTMVLYDSILASYAKELRDRKSSFDLALATLLARDKQELTQLFVGIWTSGSLASIAAAYEQRVQLFRPAPARIQLKPGLGEVLRPEDLELEVQQLRRASLPAFPAPYDFLGPMLADWTAYQLFSYLHDEVFSRRMLFELRATDPAGRAGLPPGLGALTDLQDMLRDVYGHAPIVSTPRGIGYLRSWWAGGTTVIYRKRHLRGGYRTIWESMLAVLDRWVQGMGELERMKLAFALYDLWGKIGRRLSDLLSWRALVAIVGFALFILGIQFVPFANLVVDAILAFYFWQSVAAILEMLGRLVATDQACRDATGFLGIYGASSYLKGMDATMVDALVDLVTFGAGKLVKYAKYAKDRKQPTFKDVDQIVEEDAIKHGPAPVRDAAKSAKARKRTHEKWEQTLDPGSRAALEADPGLAKTYRDMDPDVRKILTRCSNDCIMIHPPPSPAQQARVKEMLDRTGAGGHKGLQEYLKLNRDRLDDALDDLAPLQSKREVDEFIRTVRAQDDQIIRYGRSLGGEPRFRNGRWEFHKPGEPPVVEFTVTPYGKAPRSEGFFESHHGVQGQWALDKKIPGYNYKAQPGLLLRDSRTGTPHYIVSMRQRARRGGRRDRTYADELDRFREDLEAVRAAGFHVPDDAVDEALRQTNEYFKGLYEQAVQSGMSPARLEEIFGSWKP